MLNREFILVLGFILLFFLVLIALFYPYWGSCQSGFVKKVMMTLLLCFPLFCFSSYWQWGAWNQLTHYWWLQQKMLQVQTILATEPRDAIITHLQFFLKNHPTKAKGWYLLGKLFLLNNDYPAATEAFAKAHRYAPHNIDYTRIYQYVLKLPIKGKNND